MTSWYVRGYCHCWGATMWLPGQLEQARLPPNLLPWALCHPYAMHALLTVAASRYTFLYKFVHTCNILTGLGGKGTTVIGDGCREKQIFRRTGWKDAVGLFSKELGFRLYHTSACIRKAHFHCHFTYSMPVSIMPHSQISEHAQNKARN